MKRLALAAAVMIAATAPAFAGPPQTHKGAAAHKAAHAVAHKATLICPVTGDKIATVKAAAGHSAYKRKTYYFCCPACKPKFDKNPAKYVRNSKKGIFEKM